ncbi:MAG: adenylate/guanylate cyclase domain-containing protein, partial [Deltaproteobacteria bacterium]|nr:adenylate/guanylate cyclase domain-containing protein [Deltaproteobacteria bacterium]
RALDELFASAAWQGLPPLKTRFGLHTGEALVGHFGTDERLAYTALGDSVNLSARLEGLCKSYGVTVLVSESVAEAAREAFVFRLVDRVAVKGKLKGVNVYELVGERTASTAVVELHQTYERAFAAYENRDFEGALGLLAGQLLDGPSKVLFARCRAYLASPPPPVWNATHVALEK